ncbi:hypothetical protein [Tautonia sociabilis]|uniref:Glycosyltransferase RgtA/B/C/D-like domain-containing protein n=1 Tax=Tautonia sociabilis TaxID=2080755 RepID=A0A432MK63_9BACT|nr:hypothetical protein [Tautonia sociabilis]RUL87791.1 hypothetical protein TsocGM_10540 [Tautonia sociabilis]
MISRTGRQRSAVFPHDRFVGERPLLGEPGADPSTRPSGRAAPAIRPLGVMSVVGVLGFLFVANLGVALFVNNEQFLYYYDGAGWWEWSRQYMSLQSQSFWRSIGEVFETIRTKDQNLLAAVPLGTWMRLAGESRLSYELAVTNIYGGACLLGLMILVRGFWSERESARAGWWLELVPAAALLLLPAFWVPILRGYPEAGGMAMALVVLWLYFSSTDRRSYHPAYFAIGVLLAGLFIFRRWYAYWVVAFLAISALDRAVLAVMDLRRNGFDWRRLARLTLPVPVMGLVAFAVLAGLAMPMVRRVLETDFADIYSAYNRGGGLIGNLTLSFRPFGWLPTLLGVASLLYLAAGRSTRRMSLFVGAQAVLIVALFFRIQFLMMHQLYMLLPGYLLVCCVAATRIAGLLPNRTLRAGWLGGLLAIGLTVSVPTYCGAARPLIEPIAGLLPERCQPLVRHDLDAFIRLNSAIEEHLAGTDGKVYVLASSISISADHLIHAGPSLRMPFPSANRVIGRWCIVDKTNSFPRELLQADLVVVASPIQYHLDPSDQRIVGIPARHFLEGTGIARAFERLPETFTIEQGIEVYLFKKTRPIEPSEVAELSDQLREAYPDRPYIYTPY